MQIIGKFDQKINVIPNGMGKQRAFMLGKNLDFINSM